MNSENQDNKANSQTPLPIRVAVFDSITAATDAIEKLRAHGFKESELTVFCANEYQQRQFEEDERPPGEAGERGGDVKTAAAGSAIGGILGGLTAIAGLAAGGLPVLAAGGMAGALTGGVVGGLGGAMMSRGIEKEPADFFDQAVADGQILVAVEPDPSTPRRLDLAATVLQMAGAQPVSLREG